MPADRECPVVFGLIVLALGFSDELEVAEPRRPEPTPTPESASATEPPTTTAPASTTTAKAVTTITTPTTSTVDWELVTLQDVSFGTVLRYVAHVVTEPGVTAAELEEVAQEIAEELRETGVHYHASAVGFYDYPEYVGFGFVMGSWEHAPYGDWARASEANLGEYGSFEEVSHLRDKDWSQRPTPAQVAIWFQWEQTLAEISDFPDFEDEELAYNQVASDLGIARSQVVQAVEAAALWPFR